ncbi:hypothetical protein KAR91_71715 [Candidatus Pacearchaeota archaeon]|nr:hypothetical protein [Candidatus Pacearchaeota archaeon]
MAVGIKSSFNKYKKQGLTDTQAMKRAMSDQAKAITKIRKADVAVAKKKRGTWVSRLKKGVKTALTGPGHSPAGKKYLGRRK